jgi:CubicO group peptidase (beta-lactamase class C family)
VDRPARFASGAADRRSGHGWHYGINTDWLGQVVEAVSGQDLASYLEENVFAPLGMSDTTFAPTSEQRARMMSIHSRSSDGALAVSDLDVPVAEPEFWAAGHGAHGTPRDYARLMAALLRGGELDGNRILREETAELMFTDHLGAIRLPEVTKSVMPELSNDVPSPPFAQGFGLGLHVFTQDLPGMRHAGSGDWAGLCNCFYWIDRTAGVAGAFLTQVLPFFDGPIVEASLAAEQAVYAELSSGREPDPASTSPAAWPSRTPPGCA